MGKQYDVAIIGAGVCGAAIARELSRYDAAVCVLEKEEDICCGTTKANSAIIHGGHDPVPGTWKAKLNVQGNRMMDQLARELDIPFVRNGAMVVCTAPERLPELETLRLRGVENGVDGMRILSREEAVQREPNLSDAVCGALLIPTSGIVCPFELNLALAENASANGVDFFFDSEVRAIHRGDDGVFRIEIASGEVVLACAVVNAAGVFADRIHNMVSSVKMTIRPRRGEYVLLDKQAGTHVSSTIFALPDAAGKGVLVTPTVHGNLLVGPTSEQIADREGTDTTAAGLALVVEKASRSVKDLPFGSVITSFAGLRASGETKDFRIGEVQDCPCFFDCAAIDSPGLSSAPAIGVMVAGLVRERLSLKEKPSFQAVRRGIVRMESLTIEERNARIRKNPAYGSIVCRCEKISEGEIVDAIRRPLGARSLDGVKRRVRAGMGRCQGGFCAPRVMEILARERKIAMKEVTKSGGDSKMIC